MATPKKTATPKKAKKPSPKAMTKADLIADLAGSVGLTKAKTAELVYRLRTIAQREIGFGRAFIVPGIVRLKVAERPARAERQGRNPKTGETMTIPAQPAQKIVRAKPTAEIRNAI